MLASLAVLLPETRLFITEKEMSQVPKATDLVNDSLESSLLPLTRLKYNLPSTNLKMDSLLEVIWTLSRQ
jgi:hypothetical protein